MPPESIRTPTLTLHSVHYSKTIHCRVMKLAKTFNNTSENICLELVIDCTNFLLNYIRQTLVVIFDKVQANIRWNLALLFAVLFLQISLRVFDGIKVW